jgi:preprotein translocase subunit SecY
MMAMGLFAKINEPAMRRRLLVTIGVLVIYRVGCLLPMPGLDGAALTTFARSSGLDGQMFTIFALGLTPLFSILLLIEIARSIIPPFDRWERSTPGVAQSLRRYTVLVALAMAIYQSSGIATAMESVSGLVPEPGPAFRLSVVVTLVGATAVLIWLSERITIDGLCNGFWLLLATPALINLFKMIQYSIQSGRLEIVAYFAVAVIAVVAALLTRSARLGITPDDLADDFEIVWPPLLATYIAGFVTFGLAMAMNQGRPILTPATATGGWVHMLAVAVLIVALNFLRTLGRDDPRNKIDVEMICAQTAVCVGGEWLVAALRLPFQLNGPYVIIMVAVAMNMLATVRAATPRADEPRVAVA